MNKRVYLAPASTVTAVSLERPLAGSTQATIPDAGWGNVKEASDGLDIWGDNEIIDEE